MNTLHAQGLPSDGMLSTEYIQAHVDMLQLQNWRDDTVTRRQLVQSLDVLAEHLVGRHSPADELLKEVIRRLRAEVTR
jgi:hypothetical protein